MKKQWGVTIIELIIFIVIVTIITAGIIQPFVLVLNNSVRIQQQSPAVQLVSQCLDWFVAQRYLSGYSTITCPSTDVPSYCQTPTGYTITDSISCLTINSDASYKQITVTVTGKNSARSSLIIANY